jgi:hypothetical protein
VKAIPGWVTVILVASALADVAFGFTCFFASPVLFGSDAYRTLARVPIGLLAATAIGIGTSTLFATITRDRHGMRIAAMCLFVSAACVPPVVGFNIGAFDRIDTSGVRTASIVCLFVFAVALPQLASLLALNRIVKSGESI